MTEVVRSAALTTMSAAINQALREEMRSDPRVLVIGQDVGRFGGAFLVTRGLLDEFGPSRVRDCPISEAAIIGCAVGASLMGWRTVAEMQYSDFVACGMDQIANEAAKIRLMSGGKIGVPLVLRLPTGASEHGAQHDQSLEAWFVHTPGLKVVFPSTAADAKGLLKASIRDEDPVVFMEHKLLYGTKSVGGRADEPAKPGPALAAEPDNGEEPIPLGIASVRRAGSDITIVATGLMVSRSLEAASRLSRLGIEAEVIDPRTLVPLDRACLVSSVRKTGRLLVVSEETGRASFASEVSASIGEEAWASLKGPPRRLTTADVPLPFTPEAQRALIPSVEAVVDATLRILGAARTQGAADAP